jgi:hypothetical protein
VQEFGADEKVRGNGWERAYSLRVDSQRMTYYYSLHSDDGGDVTSELYPWAILKLLREKNKYIYS